MREWTHPYVKWFVDAKCNIVYNALDRHMGTPVQDKVAFYWEAENGDREPSPIESFIRTSTDLPTR